MTLNHVYRMRTRGTLLGQRVEWGVHLRHDAGTATPTDVLGTWNATILPLLLPAVSAGVAFDDLVMQDVSPTGDQTVHLALSPAQAGTVTGDALPPQDALVVRLNTGSKGRRAHGRFYLPGLSETFVASATLSGTQLTAVQALATGLITNFGPTGTQGGYHLVVYSPIDTTPPPPKKWKPKTTELITPITGATVDPIVRTQRRRALGVGR